MALHSYFTLNWQFFFYNSLTLSCLLPQEFSHSCSSRPNWTQSRNKNKNLVLSQLVIRSKKQEQELEPEQEQGNKNKWKSNYNDVCSPVDDKAHKKFSDFFFFFSATDLITNQTNKSLSQHKLYNKKF